MLHIEFRNPHVQCFCCKEIKGWIEGGGVGGSSGHYSFSDRHPLLPNTQTPSKLIENMQKTHTTIPNILTQNILIQSTLIQNIHADTKSVDSSHNTRYGSSRRGSKYDRSCDTHDDTYNYYGDYDTKYDPQYSDQYGDYDQGYDRIS